MKRAEAEVQSLRDENKQLKGKCAKMAAAAADNEKILQNFRKTVEEDTNVKVALKGRIAELELVHSEVAKLKQAFTEIAAWAEDVYQEYKKALAVLGMKPVEVLAGILRLMDWLISEFDGLREVMSIANENAA